MVEIFRHQPWFALFFLLVLFIIVFRLSKEIMNWFKNNASPQEQATVEVVSKRTHVFGGENTRTAYYVTFEGQTGERREFRVKGSLYGLLTEGDIGTLTYQGTRFLDFMRKS